MDGSQMTFAYVAVDSISDLLRSHYIVVPPGISPARR